VVTFEAGSQLGAYEILGLLGSGGMGEVYRATDSRPGHDVESLDRRVARGRMPVDEALAAADPPRQ
jgi:serine/threonine protein kinase